MADTDTAPRAPLLLRWLLLLLAVASLVLAVIGLFLPVVPTVPFVLLAAWAAARSSPRLSKWLESHPRMGPHIRDWRQGGVVRRPAKWMATAMMSISGAGMLFFAGARWQVLATLGFLAAVLVWLWFRPETAPS